MVFFVRGVVVLFVGGVVVVAYYKIKRKNDCIYIGN